MPKLELRPSNAHRWLICPGQPLAVSELADRSSIYADKGTVAHGLLELALRLELTDADLELYEGKTLKGLPQIPIDETMLRGIGHALDYVRSYLAQYTSATYHPEQEVPIKLGKYRTSGTLDVALDNLPEELVIMDYKNGVVYVEHEENPQLLLYALGYLQRETKRVRPHTRVKLIIVQPNARAETGPVREHLVDRRTFDTFIQTAIAAADAVHAPNPPRVAGEHCRFCRAAGRCNTYAEYVLRQAGLDFTAVEEPMLDTADMQPEDLARVLNAMEMLRAWLTSVEDTAIEQMLNGVEVPGYKVVNSQPRRKWDDEGAVLKLLQKFKLDPDRFAPRSPLSPARIEKVLRRKDAPPLPEAKVVQLLTHITANPVEPRVAPVDDPRQPYIPGSEFR